MGVEIEGHIGTLEEFASRCNSVAEFGVDGADDTGSTQALLKGVKKKMVSVDIRDFDLSHVTELAKELGKDWWFVKGNSTKVDIPEVDFLFIDTLHEADHVEAELNRHLDRVRTYVGFHDTHCRSYIAYGEKVREIMGENPDWEMVHDEEDWNGLTIYQRRG